VYYLAWGRRHALLNRESSSKSDTSADVQDAR
jgi:hypothetical protein